MLLNRPLLATSGPSVVWKDIAHLASYAEKYPNRNLYSEAIDRAQDKISPVFVTTKFGALFRSMEVSRDIIVPLTTPETWFSDDGKVEYSFEPLEGFSLSKYQRDGRNLYYRFVEPETEQPYSNDYWWTHRQIRKNPSYVEDWYGPLDYGSVDDLKASENSAVLEDAGFVDWYKIPVPGAGVVEINTNRDLEGGD